MLAKCMAHIVNVKLEGYIVGMGERGGEGHELKQIARKGERERKGRGKEGGRESMLFIVRFRSFDRK